MNLSFDYYERTTNLLYIFVREYRLYVLYCIKPRTRQKPQVIDIVAVAYRKLSAWFLSVLENRNYLL